MLPWPSTSSPASSKKSASSRLTEREVKFLVGRDGTVLERYAPTTKPEDIAADIEKALVR